MDSFPESDQIRNALQRTWEGLGLTPGVTLEPMAASVFLKYLLLEGWGLEKTPSRRRCEHLVERLQSTRQADKSLESALRVLKSSRPYYRLRLLELVEEALMGERLAPEICLCPQPLDATALAPGSHRHAVVFTAKPGFAHEFYALAVDAYVHDVMGQGQSRTLVLGVHADWLEADGAVRRTLCLDPERNRLVEADWERSFHPDSVQFLCLGNREQSLHGELAGRFACPKVNPYAPSALADDKAATLTGWSELGLEIPRYRKIERGDWAAARDLVDEFPETVLKPNADTEGRGVAYLSRCEPGIDIKLRDSLEYCWRQGAALVQQRRDGVLFRDPDSGRNHTLALRFNLVFEGRRHQLTSGFAQIGADVLHPAACGRGGRILSLDQALSGLVARRDPTLRVAGPDPSLWADLVYQAERAAGFFNRVLLVGLDVLLDLNCDDRLVPVFLEANPRPAGLCHSRLLSGLPSPRDQAGVGPALWDGLETLCRGAVLHPAPLEPRVPSGVVHGLRHS